MSWKTFAWQPLMALLLIVGCAHTKVPISYENTAADTFQWPSVALKEAFAEYWTLRAQNYWKATFALEAPYLQEIVPHNMYRRVVDGGQAGIDRIELRGIKQENDAYYVISLKLFLSGADKGQKAIFLSDPWVESGGRWFHVIKDPVYKRFFP